MVGVEGLAVAGRAAAGAGVGGMRDDREGCMFGAIKPSQIPKTYKKSYNLWNFVGPCSILLVSIWREKPEKGESRETQEVIACLLLRRVGSACPSFEKS